jgi:hypothetical protein
VSPVASQNQADDLALVKSAISLDRFESHRASSSDSDETVFRRYRWNAMICEHFYAPLRILEVVTRNSFDAAISSKLGNPHWLTSVPQWLQPNGRDDVKYSLDTLAERSRPITQGRMVQEMSFGFWVSLLNSKYETLYHGIGARVFPGMPPGPKRTRAEALKRFENIRILRNRIFHCRRIWNRLNLEQDYNQILEAIEWVNTDARRLLLPSDAVSKFLTAMASRP